MKKCPTEEIYDKYITNRCDLWVTTSLTLCNTVQVKNIRTYLKNDNCLILNHHPFLCYKMRKLRQEPKFEEIKEYVNASNVISRQMCDQMMKKYDIKLERGKWPSTGLLTIMYALERHECVYILGFTFNEGKNHVNDDTPRHNNHNFKKEKDIVNNLIKRNKVIALD
tara:strand:- start:3665 stop:4165 length:501 start_codon:yes stop_codon:yes gene_type:complete